MTLKSLMKISLPMMQTMKRVTLGFDIYAAIPAGPVEFGIAYQSLQRLPLAPLFLLKMILTPMVSVSLVNLLGLKQACHLALEMMRAQMMTLK